ncbi:hypothetical protein WICPIJ_007076 [Wickerhamomyces pijperi]|uniref:Secreted protein n=1 Tax=Wickerhamomyces pijperi TaxID=599730 RepID=A0A9P8Q2L4_WICPI|nr:hypothetical protein WICPIJ_007076 [Wickerhamomyces pijperi]
MVVGWILFFTNSLALFKSSEAMITTDVVPSPTSLSCCWANSTKILPAGCLTSNKDKMVAPSLVTTTSPMSSTNILSKPTGPNEDLTTLATASAARTFWLRMSSPLNFSPPRTVHVFVSNLISL